MEAEFSQPLCIALQIGLVNLLRSWGVSPAAVVGHSSGEIAAAYASGAITAIVAIIVAYYRRQVTKIQTRPSGMLAVGMGQEAVAPYLVKGVLVARVNSPESVTLSGDKELLDQIAKIIEDKQSDTLVRHLKVRITYHSRKLLQNGTWCSKVRSKNNILCQQFDRSYERIGPSYQTLLNDHVPTGQMLVPFFSSVTGKVVQNSTQLDSSYWR